MWFLLDRALKKVTSNEEIRQREIKITISRFLKAYRFLIQATVYENIELHKRFNFLSYLIKEINPGSGGNNFDIADKITVSDFRQQEMERHEEGKIEATPEIKITKPLPASLEEDQKRKLSELIEEVNARYDKNYEPNSTSKAALQIKDLILNTPELRARLQKSAKSNALSEFEFTFNECVQDALVGAYDQNVDFFTLLLNNDEVRAKISRVFMEEIYDSLHNSKL
jgi:type I restriction enzyme R subunit